MLNKPPLLGWSFSCKSKYGRVRANLKSPSSSLNHSNSLAKPLPLSFSFTVMSIASWMRSLTVASLPDSLNNWRIFLPSGVLLLANIPLCRGSFYSIYNSFQYIRQLAHQAGNSGIGAGGITVATGGTIVRNPFGVFKTDARHVPEKGRIPQA